LIPSPTNKRSILYIIEIFLFFESTHILENKGRIGLVFVFTQAQKLKQNNFFFLFSVAKKETKSAFQIFLGFFSFHCVA
jgi:hypothetical protein